MENIKICYTASEGGHTHELMQLEELLQKYPGIFITESRNVTSGFDAVYTIPQVNRKSLRFLFIGKLMDINVIYVESYTRIKDLSLTGKILYPVADLFIVQWKQLLYNYPKAVYGGALF